MRDREREAELGWLRPSALTLQSAVAWALQHCRSSRHGEQLALYVQNRALAAGAMPSSALHCLFFLHDFFHHWCVVNGPATLRH